MIKAKLEETNKLTREERDLVSKVKQRREMLQMPFGSHICQPLHAVFSDKPKQAEDKMQNVKCDGGTKINPTLINRNTCSLRKTP